MDDYFRVLFSGNFNTVYSLGRMGGIFFPERFFLDISLAIDQVLMSILEVNTIHSRLIEVLSKINFCDTIEKMNKIGLLANILDFLKSLLKQSYGFLILFEMS